MKRAEILVSVLMALGVALADPPPFGTEIQGWRPPLGHEYAYGITWRRESGRFYLLGGSHDVWSLDPYDPMGTLEPVPWEFADLDTTTAEFPLNICWDDGLGCFWSLTLVGEPGCYLLRYVWHVDHWAWDGLPGDSWRIDSRVTGAGRLLWDFEYDDVTRRLWGLVSSSSSDSGRFLLLDPLAKTVVDSVRYQPSFHRNLTLIPWDSSYFLTCHRNTVQYWKYDSAGRILQNHGALLLPYDWALHFPGSPQQEDTVCAYVVTSRSHECYLQRISTGMLWGQLGSVDVRDRAPEPQAAMVSATLVRDVLKLSQDTTASRAGAPDPVPSPELLDASGRKVTELVPGVNDIRYIAPGIYYIRMTSGDFLISRKVIKLQ